MVRARLLLPAAYYLRCRRRKSILQSLLWARPTVCAVGRSAWPFPEKDPPKFLRSKWFRYGFLAFFFIMFFQMLWNTWLVFEGAQGLHQVVKLLWTIKLPWQWAYHGETVAPWAVQFSFGFYSIMLTSTVLGIITMAFFKPRSWCVYCPMGTMTQLICKAKAGKSVSLSRNDAGNTCTIQSE